MKIYSYMLPIIILFVTVQFSVSCSKNNEVNNRPEGTVVPDDIPDEVVSDFADISFANWKVTLPVDENNNGKPDEYQPNELINLGYQSLEPVKPYMYDDISDSSLVFYTYPESSTTNSSYSRTELRELINTSNSKDNWTLEEGGIMEGRLKIESISENIGGSTDYHRVIIMQIHGIISEEDMATHGFSSNNGPPLLKIYWKDGYIWSHKKSLIDETTNGDDLLETSNNTWTDVKVNFGYVGYNPFDFRIKASDAKLEVQLNNEDVYVYEDISLDKWPYENYFKAGNYLITTDSGAFSYVKYYNLSITH